MCVCVCVWCVATHKTCPTPWKAAKGIVCVALIHCEREKTRRKLQNWMWTRSDSRWKTLKCMPCPATSTLSSWILENRTKLQCKQTTPTGSIANADSIDARTCQEMTVMSACRWQLLVVPTPATQKWRSMSPSASPATQSDGRCHQVPRLPRKAKVDVTKCYTCHANGHGDNGGKREPSASPEPAQCRNRHDCHAKWRSMSPSATPATQSDGRCHQVPRLPCKTKVDVTKCHACHANGHSDNGGKREPSASPEPAQCLKCHVCHAKWRSMSPSATPRPRRQRRQTETKRATRASHVLNCRVCHAKWRSMSPSATPATQSDSRCHQAPRLPRKWPRRQRRQTGTKRVTRASPVP